MSDLEMSDIREPMYSDMATRVRWWGVGAYAEDFDVRVLQSRVANVNLEMQTRDAKLLLRLCQNVMAGCVK